MKRGQTTWLLLGLLLLWGCGGGDEEANTDTPAPGGQPVASGENGKAPDDTTPDNAAPADSSGSGSENTTAKVEFQPADGALVAHARMLSMVAPQHFAVLKLDLEKIRNAGLVKKLPGSIDDLANEIPGGVMPPDSAETLREVEVICVALAPGSGRFDQLFGVGESRTEEFHVPGNAGGEANGGEEFGPPAEGEFGAPGDVGAAAPVAGQGGEEQMPVNAAVYARFKTKEGLQAFLAMMPEWKDGSMAKVDHNGETFYKSNQAPISILPGERDIFVTSQDDVLKQVIDAGGKVAKAPLMAKLQGTNLDAHVVAVASLGPVRDSINAVMNDPELQLPAQVKMPVAHLDTVALSIDIEGPNMIALNIDATDEAGAQMLRDMAQGLVGMGNKGIEAVKAEMESQKPNPQMESAYQRIFQFANKVLADISIQQSGKQLTVALNRPAGLEQIVDTAAAVAEQAAMRVQVMNNGHQIGIASKIHQTKGGGVLSDIATDGTPILSWRVALLTYLEAGDVDVKKNEAWDSDHNQALLEQMPAVFATPSAPESGTTTWKMLPAKAASDIQFIDAGKGTAVPWTKPEAFKVASADPLASFGEEPAGGYVAVFVDGHVQSLSAEALKEYFAKETGTSDPDGDSASPDPEDGTDTGKPNILDNTGLDVPTDDPDEPQDEVRVWKDATGKHSVKATLIKVASGKVTLKRVEDGKEVTLAFDKLSAEDQAYLKAKFKK